MPASQPVTLGNAGTYYAVASYSGDAGNGASRTRCGDETALNGSPSMDGDPFTAQALGSARAAARGCR
jgi:hypothetical protein